MTENVQIFMEKDRLQPLADNIKVLKGSDSITLQQMEDTIEETNTDIVSQTDLIAQLASALQGKSVPGGSGEDITAETTTYTDLLTDLEAAVDALPNAGSGSSGGSVETCTVKLIIRSGWNQYGFTVYKNGVIDVETVTAPFSAGTTIVAENVVCGSMFSVYPSGASIEASITGGAILVGHYQHMLFKATMTANETTEITIYSNL